MIKSTLVLLTAFLVNSALACDCRELAGIWTTMNEETHAGTFMNIPANCQNIKVAVLPESKKVDGLVPDRILCQGGKFRMQYRFPKGYVDDEGTKAVYPMSRDVAARLQGDIRVNEDQTLELGLDMFDASCVRSTGRPCGSARFTRLPKELFSKRK